MELKDKELPIIKIVKETPSDEVKLDLEMDDDAYDRIVEIGKEEVSENDFFKIGFKFLIESHLKPLSED